MGIQKIDFYYVCMYLQVSIFVKTQGFLQLPVPVKVTVFVQTQKFLQIKELIQTHKPVQI